MPIPVVDISDTETAKVIEITEGHFSDVKDIRITPSKLTHTLSALSNTEGGEVYIGISEDRSTRARSWRGFNVPEDANAHIQVFEELFPLGEGYGYTFLKSATGGGYVLKVEVTKSRDVKKASDGVVYIRRSAQNLRVSTEEALTRLRRTSWVKS
jgi:ATP-dependent DNA helicase RecG